MSEWAKQEILGDLGEYIRDVWPEYSDCYDLADLEDVEAKVGFYRDKVYCGGDVEDTELFAILDRKPNTRPTGEVRTILVPPKIRFEDYFGLFEDFDL